MSGFAGVVSADGGTPDAKLIERMAERLAFRGPDATQIWTSPGAGFGALCELIVSDARSVLASKARMVVAAGQ
jgi:asparagine synthetase B (glutamine-hydrolysing)